MTLYTELKQSNTYTPMTGAQAACFLGVLASDLAVHVAPWAQPDVFDTCKSHYQILYVYTYTVQNFVNYCTDSSHYNSK